VLNALSAPLRLTSGNGLVLYRNILPERYSITVPFREIVDERSLGLTDDYLPGSDVLYYDQRGHLRRGFIRACSSIPISDGSFAGSASWDSRARA